MEPAAFDGGCKRGVSGPSCCDLVLGVTFKLGQGHQALARVDGEISVFGIVARPTRFPQRFNVRPASSWGAMGTLQFLCRESRGIDPHLEMRRGKGAQTEVCRETPCSSRPGTAMLVNILSFIKGVKYPFTFQEGT